MIYRENKLTFTEVSSGKAFVGDCIVFFFSNSLVLVLGTDFVVQSEFESNTCRLLVA